MSKTVRERAIDLGMKAMTRLMEDPKRAEKVADLMMKAQRGKEALDRAQAKALNMAGLVSRADVKAIGRRLSSLKHKVRELDEQIAALERKLAR